MESISCEQMASVAVLASMGACSAMTEVCAREQRLLFLVVVCLDVVLETAHCNMCLGCFSCFSFVEACAVLLKF